MGWRKTGMLRAPEEILVMTCDVCERDIGYEDGRRPRPHYEINRLPNQAGLGDPTSAAFICSPECLRAFAAQASNDPKGLPPREGGLTPSPKAPG
jgi:hypothetical protein